MARSVWHLPLKLHSAGQPCCARVLLPCVRGETRFPLPSSQRFHEGQGCCEFGRVTPPFWCVHALILLLICDFPFVT